MLATWIIVFREVLEAGLIVGIVLAATEGVAGRGLWVGAGIAAGVLGASALAGFAESVASAFAGAGHELFNASVLFLAVLMLGWHNVWMGRHGRDMARRIQAEGRAAAQGLRPLYALALVVGVAVLREGSEVVLFLYGIALSARLEAGPMLLGGTLGILSGAGVSLLLYLGLLRIPTRNLFAVTSALLALLAAGMAAQGAGFLVEADLLPALRRTVWDTSWLLSDHSMAGRVLSTLTGYVDRPSGIQLLFYAGTLAVIALLTLLFGRSSGVEEPGLPGELVAGDPLPLARAGGATPRDDLAKVS